MVSSVANAPPRPAARREGQRRPPAPNVNVGEAERLLSLLGGGALAVLGGAGPRGLNRLVLPLVGGLLAYRGLSGHCSAYAALGLDTSEPAPATAVRAGAGVKVERAVTINKPAELLYRFWRQLDTLPQFMQHLKEVKVLGPTRSRWVAKAPMGMTAEWDAEVINDERNALIAWRSLPGSQVATAGSVRFTPAPAGRGTEVHVSLKYDPPGGKLGAWLAWLFGESPEWQVRADLMRWKQLLEAGEIATVEGQTSGREGVGRAVR
jgi:uncharacterized membrane protein